jgi:predicted nucleic acid-binding protein
MINAILDTTVIIHIIRKYPPALAYINVADYYAFTPITWFEVIVGAANKQQREQLIYSINQFQLCHHTEADQDWAITQFERFQFSHHIGYNDCLIAAVAYRLQIPLYTHNLKDMQPLLGILAVQPYQS